MIAAALSRIVTTLTISSLRKTDATLAGWELFLVAGAAAIVVAAPHARATLTDLTTTLFLAVLTVALNRFRVQLARGHLRLTMIGTNAAGLTLVPALAVVVGLASAVAWLRFAPAGRRYVGFAQPVIRTVAGASAMQLIHAPWLLRAAASLTAMTIINWLLTPILARLRDGDPILDTLRITVDRSFVTTFVYFGLGGAVIASVLDGSLRGYAIGAGVGLLCVSLVQTLQGERLRRQLESSQNYRDDYIAMSQRVQGLLHDLRNRLSVVDHALDEVQLSTQDGDFATSKRAVVAAKQKLNEVEDNLRGLYAEQHRVVDIAGIARDAVAAYAAFARSRKVRLRCHAEAEVLTRGQERLLSDAVGNLLRNAVEASPSDSTVDIRVGASNGVALLVVADQGPGVKPEHRDRLFAPAFTTKPSGKGFGLFTAYGVVRQHGGRLVYEDGLGNGAVFRIELPLANSGRQR